MPRAMERQQIVALSATEASPTLADQPDCAIDGNFPNGLSILTVGKMRARGSLGSRTDGRVYFQES